MSYLSKAIGVTQELNEATLEELDIQILRIEHIQLLHNAGHFTDAGHVHENPGRCSACPLPIPVILV